MRSKSGSVLILTVWALAFLTIFAIGLGRNIAAEINYASYFKDRLTMYYLAKGDINKAVAELTLGNRVLSEDESGKININFAPTEILISLLNVAGELDETEAADLADAIIDWRDKDIAVSPRGAENDYYASLELPYDCKNGKFQTLEESLLVRGMTPEIFSKIKDVVTIYGGQRININSASVSTFVALGLSESFAEEIVEYRQGKDGEDGTEDDNIFESVEGIREISYLFTEDSVALNRIISLNVLGVESEVFRINSLKISCVVRLLDEEEFEIVYWREE